MAENTGKATVFKKIGIFFRNIGDFFKGVKTEYSKIVFPNRESLFKQTTAVIVISVIIGVLIFALDLGMKYLLNLIL